MTTSPREMKITDLNIDCLIEVLEHFPRYKILSPAASNKRLRNAARYIFCQEDQFCKLSEELNVYDFYAFWIRAQGILFDDQRHPPEK